MVESKLIWKDGKCMTFDEHEGKLFLLGHYTFAWKDLEGVWIHENIWCEEASTALQECRNVAELFGNGEYRFYGSSYRDESMWIDQDHVLYVTKSAYAKESDNYKGVNEDGRRSIMPPLDLDYNTCLIYEGASFKIV